MVYFQNHKDKKITDNIHYCISRGMKVFGIGLGICPYGIEKLFPNVIYSKNPMKLIEGIYECCFGNFNKDEMNGISLNPEFVIYENDIKECIENPKYLSLKKELINIIIELSGYDFYQGEIPKDAKEEDMEANGIYSIHQFGMYPKNFFKGQKILFVMPYSCEMNNEENKAFSYKYIREKYKNESNYECIKSSLEYTGIDVDYVINYKDAIMKLTKSTQSEGYCDYFACAILSGPPYAELPNPDDDPYLLGQFLKVIKKFWDNGGSIGIFADNAPFTYHANLLLEELFPEVKFRIGGNHKGGDILKGDDSGLLEKPKTFNRKIQIEDNYSRISISQFALFI